MHRYTCSLGLIGGLTIALVACGGQGVAPPGALVPVLGEAESIESRDLAQARALLPERLSPDEFQTRTQRVPESEGSFRLLARTSNPHVERRGGSTQRSHHRHRDHSPGTRGAGFSQKHGPHHHGPSKGRQHSGTGRHPHHGGGGARGWGRRHGAYWYYPVGNYSFPYFLGGDGAYYPYSGLDYPYFYWRDSRWWPAQVPSEWGLDVARDDRTWVVVQEGRFFPEMVSASIAKDVVFFNAGTTPQRVLVQDSEGGVTLLGPIAPGQTSRNLSFAVPGQYRFNNPDRPGTQGWVQVN
ncbi:MAG: hypothetical protein VKN33_00730 [Candidatus Sericytochromatia bacterium]|nr:hypothetical protein [Candidatus Sericytochromatia bacterium]